MLSILHTCLPVGREISLACKSDSLAPDTNRWQGNLADVTTASSVTHIHTCTWVSRILSLSLTQPSWLAASLYMCSRVCLHAEADSQTASCCCFSLSRWLGCQEYLFDSLLTYCHSIQLRSLTHSYTQSRPSVSSVSCRCTRRRRERAA